MQTKFIYQEQTVEKILKSISSERLSTYLKPVNHNHVNALKLYIYNVKISESFYTPLQGLEITLRNAVHEQFSRQYGVDWLISGSFPFKYEQKIKIEEIVKKLKINNTIPKIIAELNLGFWVGLFGRKYEEIWRHSLRQAFKSNNGALRRKDLYHDLNNIRQLRNRIAHHEPIFYKDLLKYYENILKIISLLCPETSYWIADNSRFLEIYNSQFVQEYHNWLFYNILPSRIFHNVYYAINKCNSSTIMSLLRSVKMSLCKDINVLAKAEQDGRLIDYEQKRSFTSRSYATTTKKRIKAR